ncbi:uncharacterized protein LOC129916458 isoform X1 [Episyrphus balteatus]|uniref:uncharacterized protein LOC129916458 isoform X1 n=1 Tax=Episyrphus balteatus TaxID=286459 RepID=UPI002486A412|nr:uncharacterized protein LOC129916458 isoform X1 [Episyrphus balteatus]
MNYADTNQNHGDGKFRGPNSQKNQIQAVNRNQLEEGFLRKLNTKCSQRDNHSCMMLKLIVYMNRIFKKSSIDVNENVKVTENRGVDIPDDPDEDTLLARGLQSDDETLGLLVAGKIWRFIRSRTLRYKVTDNAEFIVTTEPKGNINLGLSVSPTDVLEEGRGKMKNMGPLMAMMATKMGIIGAVLIKGLILLTGKALIVSKIALLLAVIIALKKLLGQKHVSYEAPHHETSSGWGRAFDGFIDGFAGVPAKMLDVQEMAYAAQKPNPI